MKLNNFVPLVICLIIGVVIGWAITLRGPQPTVNQWNLNSAQIDELVEGKTLHARAVSKLQVLADSDIASFFRLTDPSEKLGKADEIISKLILIMSQDFNMRLAVNKAGTTPAPVQEGQKGMRIAPQVGPNTFRMPPPPAASPAGH